MSTNLNRTFLAERDAQIFSLKKAGLSNADIAKRLGMSSKGVAAAVQRQMRRLNAEALTAYPELLRLELERLDALQSALWPQCQPRRIQTPDGESITVDADPKAISTMLSIMDRRSKLLGLDKVNVNISIDDNPQSQTRAVLAGHESKGEITGGFSPEDEGRALLDLMRRSGMLPDDIAKLFGGGDIVDAEVVEPDDEDEAMPALGPAPEPEVLTAEVVDPGGPYVDPWLRHDDDGGH